MQGKIVALIIKEELQIEFEGKVCSLFFDGREDLFKGLKLTRTELGQLKNLPCGVREVLLAKFFLKGEVKSVVGNKQRSFNL